MESHPILQDSTSPRNLVESAIAKSKASGLPEENAYAIELEDELYPLCADHYAYRATFVEFSNPAEGWCVHLVHGAAERIP